MNDTRPPEPFTPAWEDSPARGTRPGDAMQGMSNTAAATSMVAASNDVLAQQHADAPPRVDDVRAQRPDTRHAARSKDGLEPLLAAVWPFVCIVVVIVALALADFLLEETQPSARLALLFVRLIAGASLLALAGITLRRLFIQRRELQEALAASEERFVGSLSDIEKRKQAEALLFEEKERAQVTLASIADAVVTVDTAGRIEFMNSVAERLTGWPLDEARQRPAAEVFAVVDEATGAPIPDPVARALTDGAIAEADGNVVLLCRGATTASRRSGTGWDARSAPFSSCRT
jgi:PAS domain-containing protein